MYIIERVHKASHILKMRNFLYQIYNLFVLVHQERQCAYTHKLANCLVYALIWKPNCFNGRMWLARFFHIIITIIAVMYLLSLLIIGVCLQVHSHKNYKGRKRIIVRYKETILIIMYKGTGWPTKKYNRPGFRRMIA